MRGILAIGQILIDLGIYLVNGLLTIAYALAERWTLLVSFLCGLLILLVFDNLIQRIAASAPARQGRIAPAQVNRHHQVATVAAMVAWLVAGSIFPTPVPQLGTAMWLLSVLGLILLPVERYEILWRSKAAILAYAAILLSFRIVATWALAADAREWAAIVGSLEEAQSIVARSRGTLLTVASYISWFGVPAGYAAWLVQRMVIHPMSLRDPLARAGEILYWIRQRPD